MCQEKKTRKFTIIKRGGKKNEIPVMFMEFMAPVPRRAGVNMTGC